MYSGTVLPLEMGLDGLYSTKRVPIQGLIVARNLTLENNVIQKEGGATTKTASALAAAIMAMIDWWSDTVTQRTIAILNNGTVLRDTGTWTFGTTVTTGTALTVASRTPFFYAGGREKPANNRKLFLLTGNQTPQVGSGDFTTMANISKPAADWGGSNQPTAGAIHQGRNWMIAGNTAYFSTATDHEDFTGTGSGSISVTPGRGQYLSALVPYRRMLVVWQYPYGIQVINTTDATVANWYVTPQSDAVGCAGAMGAVPTQDDVLFIDANFHFNLLSATGVDRDATASDVSTRKIGQYIRDQIDPNRGPWIQMVWYGPKQQVWVGCSALGAVTNNRKLIADFNLYQRGAVDAIKYSVSDRDVNQSIMVSLLNGVPTPYIGDNAGNVLVCDTSTRSKDAAGYTGIWQTDHSDLGEIDADFRDRRKNFDYLDIEFEPTGTSQLSVNIYIDGVLKTSTPINYDMTGGGVALGTFLIGTDKLSTSSVKKRLRHRLTWAGTRISIEGSNADPAGDFRISRLYLGCRRAE